MINIRASYIESRVVNGMRFVDQIEDVAGV